MSGGTVRTRRRRLAWLLAAIAVAVAATVAAAAVLPWFGERPDDAVPTAVVEAESFRRRVPADGNLKAAESTQLSLPASVGQPMRIAWLADDGSRVAAGDPVVLFDPTDLEKERQDAEADRTTADLKVDKQQAERTSELDKLEKDAELAGLKLDNSREFQKKDETLFSRHEILESEIDEQLATEEKDHAVASRKTRESLSDAELQLLAIERRKAQISLDRAEEGLAALTLAAPHAGLVVFRRDWRGELPRVGQTAYPGNPLAEIPNLAEMEAEVFVLEADAGGLTEGRPAKVMLEAHPERVFDATVERVDKLAKPRRRGSPVQYFAVTLGLEETVPELMKPGQRVRAWLLLDEIEDAVTVPRQAVFERDGATVVYRRGDAGAGRGGFEAVPVELGPATLGRVVVASGLSAGDVIALSDPTRRTDDTEDLGDAGGGGGGGALAGAPGAAR